MKWKKDVKVDKRNRFLQHMSENNRPVADEDWYIVEAITMGAMEDQKLVKLIMKKEESDEIVARIRLGAFLLSYGEFVDDLDEHQLI